MGNGFGTYYSTREDAYRDYDASPPLLRRAMQTAAFSWAPLPVLQKYNELCRQGQSPLTACNAVMRHMAKVERRQTIDAYGPSHPEAAR